jgi:hypothetical protein
MFFICATILAFGGWQTSFRRVLEAISSVVPYLGGFAFIVFNDSRIWTRVIYH